MVLKNVGYGVKVTAPVPGLTLQKGEIAACFVIPWSKVGKKPAPGEKWLFNAICDFTHPDPKFGRIYSVWEHNFDQATWRNTLDRQGTLQF